MILFKFCKGCGFKFFFPGRFLFCGPCRAIRG